LQKENNVLSGLQGKKFYKQKSCEAIWLSIFPNRFYTHQEEKIKSLYVDYK